MRENMTSGTRGPAVIPWLAMLLISVGASAQAEDIVISVPQDTIIDAGSTFVMPVRISDLTRADNVTAFEFRIRHSTDVVEVDTVTSDGWYPTGYFLYNELESGLVSVAYAGKSPIVGSGPLVWVTITVGESLPAGAVGDVTILPNGVDKDFYLNEGDLDSKRGQVAQSGVIRVRVDGAVSQAPIFTSEATNTYQAVSDAAPPLAVFATVPGGEAVTYELISGDLPVGLTMAADGSFSGNAWPASAGSYEATIRAYSGALADTTVLVMFADNKEPVYDTIGTNISQNISLGEGLLPLVAADPEGWLLTFSLVEGELPSGISINSDGSFSGVADSNSLSNTAVVIGISDGARSITRPFDIWVDVVGIADNAPARATPALRIWPNPFNNLVTMAFEAPEGEWQGAIYSPTGTAVRRIEGKSGDRLTWDGTDQAGRRASSGVYIVRVSSGRRSLSASLTLLR